MKDSLVIGGFVVATVVIIAFGFAPHFAWAQDSSTRNSILNAPGDAVRVQLFDAFSGQPIANVDVEVESDNGIVCRMAPCPNKAKRWAGRSDDAGRVTIPRSTLLSVTFVSTHLYHVGSLWDALPSSSDTWVIELFPKRLDEAGEVHWRGDNLTGLDLRGYRLIDARTGKPLANKAVRLEFPLIGPLDTKTNSLGYVFFPLERALGPSFEPEAWVTAAGYQRTKLDLEALQSGTKLARQGRSAQRDR